MNITRGKIPGAKKCVLYGVEGIGKSTFAAQFPKPIFIDTEGSTKELDVARFDPPTSWEMILEEVRYVIAHPDTCETMVIDTLDWAEKLCIKSVCAKYQKSGIEAFDYGRGYTFVYEAFGELLNLLTDVTEKNIHVLLTAHATTKRREQPEEFGTYDCWGLKLIDSPKCSVANMVKEYADIVLFANYKVLVIAADDKGKHHKAQGGKRMLYTTHTPFWDAKNRLGLPEEMAMDWEALAPYLPGRSGGETGDGRQVAAPTNHPPAESPVGADIIRPSTTNTRVSGDAAGADDHGGLSTGSAVGAKETACTGVQDPQGNGNAQETGDAGPVPAVLALLLESAGVTEAEVREVIAKRQGSFPMGTTWQVMEDCGFVQGWVLPYWKNIVEMIEENPERLPFTMNDNT